MGKRKPYSLSKLKSILGYVLALTEEYNAKVTMMDAEGNQYVAVDSTFNRTTGNVLIHLDKVK